MYAILDIGDQFVNTMLFSAGSATVLNCALSLSQLEVLVKDFEVVGSCHSSEAHFWRVKGFLEYNNHATAKNVLQGYTSIMLPNTERPFFLKQTTFSTVY